MTLEFDRLHLGAFVLTCIAGVLYVFGNFLPNWWMQLITVRRVNESSIVYKEHFKNISFALTEEKMVNRSITLIGDHTVKQSFTLFGDVVCGNIGCFPNSSAVAKTMQSSDLTSWLLTVRIFGIIGMSLVILALVIQLIFFLKKNKKVSIAAIVVLLAAGLVGFLNGFILVSKYTVLTNIYTVDRHPDSLVYNDGASALILIAFIFCIVAAVATGYGLRRPSWGRLLLTS